MRMIRVAGTVATAGAVLLTPSLAAAQSLVVKVSGRQVTLAGYRPAATGLQGALDRFGPPSATSRPAAEACHATWSSVGLRMIFANFGGLDPCSPEGGNAQVAVMRGSRWQTSRGLRVGDPLSRLRRLYPNAAARGGLWWLATSYTPIGVGGYYPVLSAAVGRSKVRALRAYIGAAGD